MEIIKEQNFVSAVVYIHNNEKQIKHFMNGLNAVLEANFLKFEIIAVNDNSTDNSILILKETVKSFKRKNTTLLNMSYHHGLEQAMNAGVDLAIGDFVFEFDNSISDYNWNMIMDVYYTSLKGYDIVSASVEDHLKLTSKLFYKVFNKYASSQYLIGPESFRVLSRRAINRVHSISKTIPYRKAIYANCGLKIKTLKYSTINLDFTKSASKQSQGKNIAFDSIIIFTDVAFRVSLLLSGLMIFIMLSIGVYAVIYYMLGKQPVEGWTTTTLFLSIAFFGIFTILAVILKYMSVIVNLIFKVKSYQFESIEKL